MTRFDCVMWHRDIMYHYQELRDAGHLSTEGFKQLSDDALEDLNKGLACVKEELKNG